jgi:hypothetical protein
MHICKQKNEMLSLIGNIPFLPHPQQKKAKLAEMQEKTIGINRRFEK